MVYGWKNDRYQCLYFDGDGFTMFYKRLINGKLQWTKKEQEVLDHTEQEPRRLPEDLSIKLFQWLSKNSSKQNYVLSYIYVN